MTDAERAWNETDEQRAVRVLLTRHGGDGVFKRVAAEFAAVREQERERAAEIVLRIDSPVAADGRLKLIARAIRGER